MNASTRPFPYLLLPTWWASRNRVRRREKGDLVRGLMFGGIGYQTGSVGVQLGYRYLSFDQKGPSLVQDLSMQGAYLALNYSF